MPRTNDIIRHTLKSALYTLVAYRNDAELQEGVCVRIVGFGGGWGEPSFLEVVLSAVCLILSD